PGQRMTLLLCRDRQRAEADRRDAARMAPAGQRDHSAVRLTRHALERFVERFGGDPAAAEGSLRAALVRTRRLGRNPTNGAVAVLAAHGDRALVAILQGESCLTVLTWPLFEPR